jgi:hypothetical protein
VRALRAYRPQQQLCEAAAPARADDEQISAAGLLDEHGRRRTLDDATLDLHSRVGDRLPDRRIEGRFPGAAMLVELGAENGDGALDAPCADVAPSTRHSGVGSRFPSSTASASSDFKLQPLIFGESSSEWRLSTRALRSVSGPPSTPFSGVNRGKESGGRPRERRARPAPLDGVLVVLARPGLGAFGRALASLGRTPGRDARRGSPKGAQCSSPASRSPSR